MLKKVLLVVFLFNFEDGLCRLFFFLILQKKIVAVFLFNLKKVFVGVFYFEDSFCLFCFF